MAAGRARNVAQAQLKLPPCPLKDVPYHVLMALARRIDSVNNNEGHGCMILAELLGCTTETIRSIMTRADFDRRNCNSPTMVLFNDLQSQHNPIITLRNVEMALLKLNLEAVNVLYSTENLQSIHQAYSLYAGYNDSIETNTEQSICNCMNCLHNNSYISQHNQGISTHSILSPSYVPPRQYSLLEIPRAVNPRRKPCNVPATTPDHYVNGGICWPQPISHQSGWHSLYHENNPPMETIHNACGTQQSYFIPSYTAGESRQYTSPPHVSSQDERNMHMLRCFCHENQQVCGDRQDLKDEETELTSQDYNSNVDNDEVYCTHGITSSNCPNLVPHQSQHQTQQHVRCTCYPSSLVDETFVKSSQGATDYSECTCPSDLQNNNVPLNPVQTRNNYSNQSNQPQFQLDVKNEQREYNNMGDICNSLDETKVKVLYVARKNSCCINSVSCQNGPALSVFVTYSRHSPEHVREVIELCTMLKRNGIRVRVDFSGDMQLALFQNKHDWLDHNLKIARYVIVCISPTYHEDSALPNNTAQIPDARRLDARYIYDHLQAEYISNCSRNMRVIPVIFKNSGANRSHLPLFMSTTLVYYYPQHVNSIIEFIQNFTPSVR